MSNGRSLPSIPIGKDAVKRAGGQNPGKGWAEERMSVRKLIIDDAESSMIYSGSWTTGSTVTATTHEYDSTYHRSGTTGGSVLFTFQGTGVDVYATLDRPATLGSPAPLFSIDNETPVRFNQTGDIRPDTPTPGAFMTLPRKQTLGFLCGQKPKVANRFLATFQLGRVMDARCATDATSHHPVMRFGDLSQGEHALNITCDRVSSSGPFFYFDFVVVTTSESNAPRYVIVDERDSSVSYTGNWGSSGANNEYDHSTTYSPSTPNGGTATFTFNGEQGFLPLVSVYGTTSSTLNSEDTAHNGFTIDGVDQTIYVGAANTRPMHHNQFLSVTELEAKEHTFVITQLVSRIFYLDYIVYKASNTVQGIEPGSISSSQTVSFGSQTETGSQATSGSQATPGSQSTPGSPNTPGSQATKVSQNEIDTGAVVGGIIGGVALIAIIAIVLFFILRKRQRPQIVIDPPSPMKDAHNITPYRIIEAQSLGDGVSSNAGSGSPPGSAGLGASGAAANAAYYPWLDGDNTFNADSQQRKYNSSRSDSLGVSNVSAGRPNEVVVHLTSQPLPPGLASPHSSVYTPTTVYSSGTTSRGEKAGYSRSRATSPREPPPYTAN
ncbi:hypothetical protein CPB86DRAFT_827142 [Serendipita vermifera]|nr:hypothetical protein CPB86DRAFT_827142 [Serendipita vermifera]